MALTPNLDLLALDKIVAGKPTITANDPLLTTAIAAPRTHVSYATLGAIWPAAKYAEALAVIQSLIAGGDAQKAQLAFIADRNLAVGFNPADPASPAFIAQIGTLLTQATANASTPISQADINAISTATSYPAGAIANAEDIAASVARVNAGKQRNVDLAKAAAGFAAVQTMINSAYANGIAAPSLQQKVAAFQSSMG